MTDTLATVPEQQKQVSVVRAGDRGIQFSTLGEIGKFAAVAVNSGIYKDLPSPEVAIIKIQAGLELGLTPVWALTNIFVVNGKPTVYGDALLGIILGNPQCQDVLESMVGEGENAVATCEVLRRGRSPVKRQFSVSDAKAAGLWRKAGPWTQYPQRMLQMRARAFACRDAFADALRGIAVREEVEDYPKRVDARVIEPSANLQFADESGAGREARSLEEGAHTQDKANEGSNPSPDAAPFERSDNEGVLI